jgi:hypothetical protein
LHRALAVPAVAALCFTAGAAAVPQQTLPIRTVEKKKTVKQDAKAALTATLIAETTVRTWTCQDQLGVPRTPVKQSPWKLGKHSPGFRAALLNKWVLKHRACQAALHERARQWNWQAFPSWIIRLARCESSINWYAEGSSSDGTFYSAFNISRSVYDRDAHHMGVRGWHEGPGIPSPYEQAMAVIGHMRLYGDGFSGNCHGIAHSTWE